MRVWIINKPSQFFWSPRLPHTHSEVTTRQSAAGHFTGALYEVVNLAPFVTSFSTRLMASWQLYRLHVLWVVMRCNYIGPNLMNQVNVPAAPLTFPGPVIFCLSAWVKQRLSHFVQFSHTHSGRGRKKKKKNSNIQHPTWTSYYSQSRMYWFVMGDCRFTLNVFWQSISPNMNPLIRPVKAKIMYF